MADRLWRWIGTDGSIVLLVAPDRVAAAGRVVAALAEVGVTVGRLDNDALDGVLIVMQPDARVTLDQVAIPSPVRDGLAAIADAAPGPRGRSAGPVVVTPAHTPAPAPEPTARASGAVAMEAARRAGIGRRTRDALGEESVEAAPDPKAEPAAPVEPAAPAEPVEVPARVTARADRLAKVIAASAKEGAEFPAPIVVSTGSTR